MLPGVVGGLCLLLAFFAFQILPINYVGLLLVLFGLVLLALEMVTAAFGVLAAGGVISMIFGLVMLIDSPVPELQLGWPFILTTMSTLAGVVAFLARLAVRAQRRRSVTGAAGMLGAPGEVIVPIDSGGIGRVTTHGEIWSAVAGQSIPSGVRIRVVGISGLTLTVSPDPVSGSDREGASS